MDPLFPYTTLFRSTHVLGIYHHEPVGLGYGFLRIAFVAEAIRERAAYQLDEGIERAVWMTRDELVASRSRHRSPMLLRCVDDYLAGRPLPLDIIPHQIGRAACRERGCRYV